MFRLLFLLAMPGCISPDGADDGEVPLKARKHLQAGVNRENVRTCARETTIFVGYSYSVPLLRIKDVKRSLMVF